VVVVPVVVSVIDSVVLDDELDESLESLEDEVDDEVVSNIVVVVVVVVSGTSVVMVPGPALAGPADDTGEVSVLDDDESASGPGPADSDADVPGAVPPVVAVMASQSPMHSAAGVHAVGTRATSRSSLICRACRD
jgi:hypothetical protein